MLQEFPETTDGIVRILSFKKRHLNENYISWLNDIDVVRYSEQRHQKHSFESCIAHIERQKKYGNYFLAIEVVEKKVRHVGNLGISVNSENNIADLSILVGDKTVWGTGVASRAWSLALKVLLFNLNFRMVTAGTMEVNTSMIRLMKRSGMNIDSILPGRFIFEGEAVGLVAASITKTDKIFLTIKL